MKGWSRVVCIAAVSLPCAAAAQRQAEEARAAAEPVQSRFIGEWAYVPPTVVQGPYVTTYVSSTTGIGGYTLDLEFDLPPPIGARSRDLDYVALLQRFAGQIAFLNRFAVRGGLQGEGVIPDTSASAVSVAINANWSAGGGLVFQLLDTSELMLSLTGDYQFVQRTVVSVAGAISLRDDRVRFGNLLTTQDAHDALAGATAALALTDWLGLVAEAGWLGRWEEAAGLVRDSDLSYHFLDVSGAVSANFWSRRVPIGLTAFWRELVPVGGENPYDFSRQFGGGVFYTGRPYLDFGVELFAQDDEQEAGNLVRESSRFFVAPRVRGYF